MSLTLQPMSPQRFVAWNDHLNAAFAQDKVDAGNWPAEGALERAAAENAELLPQGLATAGHHLFVAVVDGREVGSLWLFAPADGIEAFIYDIEIMPQERGNGFGRELLDAAEGWCADHSIAMLKLHVFGFNEVAISLYESSGFEITNLNMAKRIR